MDIREITTKEAQYGFLTSQARYPAFVGGWGTGKTLFAIMKGLKLSNDIPNNLGLIARQEYTDLRDSTLADVERYTQLHINRQDKEIRLSNGSKILFRHASEFNTLQNINLGWFFIEQADEITDKNIFDFLRGRLRRNEFNQGFITANATDETHWIYQYYKEQNDPDFVLFEMNTFENADVLPANFILDLKKIEKSNPNIYKRYVLNMWGISDDQFILIPYSEIEALQGIKRIYPGFREVISIDPSGGGEECPIFAFRNWEMIDSLYLHEKDTMRIVAYVLLLSKNHKIDNIAVDVIGLGRGVADRLQELGKNVYYLNSAEKSKSPDYFNKRAEMFCEVANLVKEKKVSYIIDEETRKQLSSIRYKLCKNGSIRIEEKDEIKKRIGRSPDRADCFVYGIYALGIVPERKRIGSMYEKEDEKLAGSWMTV